MFKKIIGPTDNLIKAFVFFIFFSYLMMFAFYNLGGLDYLFHIKAGEYIIANKIIPDSDVFSFTFTGKAWLDHEWLYQVMIHTVYSQGGLEALFLLKVFIFSLSFFILTFFLLKTDWMFSYPLIFYGLQISIRRFTLRPDNFSFLFLILFLIPFVFKKRKLLYFIPFIQLLWVNMHGFFFLGPVVLLLYIFLNLNNKDKEAQAFHKTLVKVTIATFLVSFLTPHPLAGFIYPFTIIKNIALGGSNVFYQNIQELKSPLQAYKGQAYFMGYLGLGALCLFFKRGLNLFYLGLYIVFALFSLNALRNVYFFVPIAIVIFADRYSEIKEFFLKDIIREKGFFLLKISFIIFAVSLSISLIGYIRGRPNQIKAYLVENNYIHTESDFLSQGHSVNPKKLLNFVKKTELPANMFNTFNIGAPLIFNSYPLRKVFIDGRTEVYGEDFFSDYLKMVDGDQEVFDRFVDLYKLKGFIISYLREAPVFLIKNVYDKGFKCVYFDKDGIVFVDKDFFDKTAGLQSSEVDFRAFNGRDIDLSGTIKDTQPAMQSHFHMGYVLYLLEYLEQSKGYLEGVLKVVPDHVLSHYYLADIYYQEGDYDKAFLYCRNSLFFAKSSGKVYKLMAKIYYKMGQVSDARELASKAKINFDEFIKEVESE
jgi:tetratricopeptide (TPR) repeat protein